MEATNNSEKYCYSGPDCLMKRCNFKHPKDVTEMIEWRKRSFRICHTACKIVLENGQSGYCARKSCANNAEWVPYFTKRMGFSAVPNACIPDASIVEAECKSCMVNKVLKHKVWRKETK